MERHFTATVYIVENSKVLLLYHRKFGKWMPPGGHLDPNETPPEGALREVKEETGLDVDFISDENILIERPNSKSFVRPYLCLLQEVPHHKETPAHQHMDFVFVARPKGGDERENPTESDGLRWFSLNDIDGLVPEVDIFADVQETVRHLLLGEKFL